MWQPVPFAFPVLLEADRSLRCLLFRLTVLSVPHRYLPLPE